jgi:biotin carboxyl carrier protein
MKKQFRITLNGKSYDVVAELVGEEESAPVAAGTPRPARSGGASAVAAAPAHKAAAAAGSNDVTSPLAGKVVALNVAVGASVQTGQKVVTLEAMKMNTVVSAHKAGTVKSILVTAGDAVEEGQALLTIE